MKKMGKFLYGIMFSFFVMMLCSCGVKNKGASVSLSVDIQESLQKNDFVFSRSLSAISRTSSTVVLPATASAILERL